jgi:pyruvate dehydrogenase E2 component (dihydrolipoamide acetyltransferase)
MNGWFVDDGYRPADVVHLGFAIALRGGGLVAPAVHDADRLSLDDLMARLRDLVVRARGGRLRASEMQDATVTVTSLGDRGVDVVHGLIYPPQVALVGFGRIAEQPWVVDGRPGVRPVVYATLSADHRVSDGHAGAAFLRRVSALLAAPELLEAAE